MRPEPIPKAPTERKVTAATLGSIGGASWGAAALWLIDEYLIGPHAQGDVPLPVQTLVFAAAAAVTAWIAGRRARHTARPDLPAHTR